MPLLLESGDYLLLEDGSLLLLESDASPVVIESFTTVEESTGSWAPTQPAGLTVGDLILMVVASDYSNSNTFSSLTADGFTEILAADNGADVQAALYYKIADAGDVSSWSVGPITQSTSADTCGWCFRISGVDATTPIDVTPTWFGDEAAHVNDINIPELSTVTDAALIIGFAATDGADLTPTSTPSAGWTFEASLESPASDSNGLGAAYFTKTQTTAGATGELEADFKAAGTDGGLGIQVAIRQSGAIPLLTVGVDTENFAATFHDPAVVAGQVVTVDVADLSAVFHQPSIDNGTASTVTLDLADLTTTFDPDFAVVAVTTPIVPGADATPFGAVFFDPTVDGTTYDNNPTIPNQGIPLPSRTIELHGVDGSIWSLACGDGPVTAGVAPAVWGTAPVAVAAEERVGAPGGFVTGARHTARDLIIPLDIRPDTGSLETVIAELSRAVDAVRGDCTLLVGRPDGTRRRIDARYLQGLELVSFERSATRRASTALSLRAHWPYWQAEEPELVAVTPAPSVWDTDEPSQWDDADLGFNDAIPFDGATVGSTYFDSGTIGFDDAVAFDGSASEAIVATLANTGDVDAWPTWEITGPCGIVSATNLTTGKTWNLPAGLAADETMVVTSRPGQASVRINGVLSLSQLDDGAALWPLPPGDSVVVLQFVDNDPGSAYEMSWTPEYLTC